MLFRYLSVGTNIQIREFKMKIIKWNGLEILCANYTIENGYITFAFGNFEIMVPEDEVTL
jgi:hypothetical protein